MRWPVGRAAAHVGAQAVADPACVAGRLFGVHGGGKAHQGGNQADAQGRRAEAFGRESGMLGLR
jgi:hypothetical protein